MRILQEVLEAALQPLRLVDDLAVPAQAEITEIRPEGYIKVKAPSPAGPAPTTTRSKSAAASKAQLKVVKTDKPAPKAAAKPATKVAKPVPATKSPAKSDKATAKEEVKKPAGKAAATEEVVLAHVDGFSDTDQADLEGTTAQIGDAIAASHALPAQHRGDAIGPGIELGVGPAPILEQQGGGLGRALGMALDQRADGTDAIRLEQQQVEQALVDRDRVRQGRKCTAQQVGETDQITALAHARGSRNRS